MQSRTKFWICKTILLTNNSASMSKSSPCCPAFMICFPCALSALPPLLQWLLEFFTGRSVFRPELGGSLYFFPSRRERTFWERKNAYIMLKKQDWWKGSHSIACLHAKFLHTPTVHVRRNPNSLLQHAWLEAQEENTFQTCCFCYLSSVYFCMN